MVFGGRLLETTFPRVVSTIGPPSRTDSGTEFTFSGGRSPAASLPPRAFAIPGPIKTRRNMPTNTHVKTRDGLIPLPRPDPRTPQAPGCAAAAVVFGGALVLEAL